MFRLHRNKAAKSGERVDFKFSNFQATQVPKGWDKLFVSIVSVETGKSIAKSSKASARNGNCQWTETLSESIWISQEDNSKDLEEFLFKFVVAMGSARTGILGEATINMASYMSSSASVSVSLPLKKCNHGTILQVKIHCLTPRIKQRDEESKDTNSHEEDPKVDNHDTDIKLDGSDNAAKNGGSSSSKDLEPTSHPGELGSRETSFSTSGSNHSFDSAGGFVVRGSFSSANNMNGDGNKPTGRDDSTSSQTSASHDKYTFEDPPQSIHSLFNSRVMGSGNLSQNPPPDIALSASNVIASSSLTNGGSSKNLLEAAEDTIEELRAEAKMWERNSQKLMLDLEILRKEFSDQSKNQATLDMELSAAYSERDALKKEIDQLKILSNPYSKELEDEIKFQKESNANLALQLRRSQESNIELVSVLQELELTIEKQKIELEDLAALRLKLNDADSSIHESLAENKDVALQLQQLQDSEKNLQVKVGFLEQALEDKNHELENERSLSNQAILDVETGYKSKLSAKEEEIVDLEARLSESIKGTNSEQMVANNGGDESLIKEIEALKVKLEELERDCNELTDENLELLFKLKESKSKSMGGSASFDFSSTEVPAKSYSSSESEVSELKLQICHLEQELEKKVHGEDQLAAFGTSTIFSEVFKQLQMALSQIKKPWYGVSSNVNEECGCDIDNLVDLKSVDVIAQRDHVESILNCLVELNRLLEARIIECEEVRKHDEAEIRDGSRTIIEAQKKLEDYIVKENNLFRSIHEIESSKMELEVKVTDLDKELTERKSEIIKLEACLLSKEEEIGLLRQSQRESESQVSELQKEKTQLEENIEIVVRESNITSKCLDDLRNDLMVLSSSVDSHVSANRILRRKMSELENGKRELELHISELELENVQLSERTSGLEAQLRYLTDERASCQLELENSKSVASSFQDEIRRLAIEMETQKVVIEQKLQDMQTKWSEAQEECDYLKRANPKLKATAERLIEECSSLQKSNGELRKQKLELHEGSTLLEAKLRESQKRFANCSKRKEKLILGESLFNQRYSEKTAEVEKLQKEVEHLNNQISATHDERERITSNSVYEASSLHADKAKLESELQEVQSKVKLIENELYIVQLESEEKLLENYRSSEEKLKTTLSDLELKLTVSEYERQQLLEETASLKVQLQKLAPLQDEVLALKAEFDAAKFERGKMEASLHLISADNEELKAEKISFIEKISSLETSTSELEDCKLNRVVLEEKILRMEGDLTAREAFCAQDAELKNELSRIRREVRQFQRKVEQLEEEKNECLKRAEALEEELKLMKEEKQGRSESSSKKFTGLSNAKVNHMTSKNETAKSTNQHRDNRRKQSTKTGQVRELLKDQQNTYSTQHQQEGDEKNGLQDKNSHAVGVDPVSKVQLLENELAEALEANKKYKVQLKRWAYILWFLAAPVVVSLFLVGYVFGASGLESAEVYVASQLTYWLSDGRKGPADSSRKSTADGEVVPKERYERTKSSLESELRDIRERYFHMSLKYAEVEAQREELVMKLKVTKNGKRWFS
ncbi:hypothetical protein CK203_009421 [Vitis vinifera]|uniref:C2 NT-type domain-containing protein n=1 Tax=Vitis vinifera TaxID=29760 RepID=A0A438JS76_VITVI|nr:hypothetical protein CK203_009421 [Vitis vinifera]